MKYILLSLLFLCSSAFALTPPPIPVATLTPGAYDSGVTRTDACNKYRQHPPACSNSNSYSTTVLGYYGVTPAATTYTVVRSVPCELGGTDTANNQFPMDKTYVSMKNKLTQKVMDNLCKSVTPITIAQARAAVDGDWITDGYRVYVSTITPTPTNTPVANTATATPTATNTPTATRTATNTPTP